MSVSNGSASDTSTPHFLFSVGESRYALPLSSVAEVAPLGKITKVPFMPTYFRGITNLRGRIVSVLDLRLKFDLPASDSSETAILVLDLGSSRVGVIVDSVDKVIPIAPGQVKPVQAPNGAIDDFLLGAIELNGTLVLMMDAAKAVKVEEWRPAIRRAA